MSDTFHPQKQPGPFKREKLTADDHVERMIELAGRIADGKVTPAAVRRLKRDDAIMVLLSLSYSGDLGRIDHPIVDAITDRIYKEGDTCRRKPTKKS